jgi:ribosomal protein S18 acetylase RimI-like enzyme
VWVQEVVTIAELTPSGFLTSIDQFVAIYGAAMGAGRDELPSRRAIMERHAVNPGFRALAATAATAGRVVAFSYAFRGLPGQWWHDVVHAGISAESGLNAARAWLDDVVEIAEVHVHPDFQARGIGRRMVLALAADRTERTAVLSTRDAPTPARKLYRSLGFADLLIDFVFPGGGPAYAVMGAVLPLAGQHGQQGQQGQ